MDAIGEWRWVVGMGKEWEAVVLQHLDYGLDYDLDYGLDYDQIVKNHLPIFFLILSLHRLVKQGTSFNIICR